MELNITKAMLLPLKYNTHRMKKDFKVKKSSKDEIRTSKLTFGGSNEMSILSRYMKCTIYQMNVSWMLELALPNETHIAGNLPTYLKADIEPASKTMCTISIQTMDKYSNFCSSKTYKTQHLQNFDKTCVGIWK